MALLSELVRMIAKVEGLEEVSVGIFARHAREAGLIAQGGRGRSAAKMTFRDAANLLIAVNGCALAKQVSDSVPLFRGLLAGITMHRLRMCAKLRTTFGTRACGALQARHNKEWGRQEERHQNRTHRKLHPLEVLLEVGVQRAVAVRKRDAAVVRAQHRCIAERQLARQRILQCTNSCAVVNGAPAFPIDRLLDIYYASERHTFTVGGMTCRARGRLCHRKITSIDVAST